MLVPDLDRGPRPPAAPLPPADPIPADWAAMALPDAWPDRLDLRDPRDLRTYLQRWLGERRAVEIPASLPGASRLPDYLRHEFHHMPNGNFSKRVADGYARWFDRLMLGRMARVRERLVQALAGSPSVLDLGCGSGTLADALVRAGIPEVWGLDPSPYLLQLAARRNPRVQLVQGLVEDTGFPTARFQGVGACFVFHELPAGIADRGMDELHRILAPGGVLAVAEPSPVHFRPRDLRRLVRVGGVAGLYFALMARWTHEPFVEDWHRRDPGAWLREHGFSLQLDDAGIPLRFLLARRD